MRNFEEEGGVESGLQSRRLQAYKVLSLSTLNTSMVKKVARCLKKNARKNRVMKTCLLMLCIFEVNFWLRFSLSMMMSILEN